ncbi:hypothetical protein KC321_g18576, partial [Hortaea werneckii]
VKEAEEAAKKQLMEDNPDLNAEDLEIKLSDRVKQAEEERKEHGEVSEGDRPAKGQREKKTKKEKKREKKERSKEKKKKNRKEKNIKGERWVGSGDADDGEDDEPEMQWALQQSLAQAAGEEEEELQQAIRESLGYDGEESAESARIDDRDRRDCAGVNEGRGEMGFEDDEFNMGLSEGIDEFSFEDEDDDGEESEEMGEADSHEHELHEGGENIMEDYDSEPKENDATGLSADMETTDPGDVEEYRHGYYEGTEEGRAKARESGSGRKAKKNSHTRLPLTELWGTTGQMTADIWQVTGTTSINSSTTSPVGARLGESMGPYAVETGWGQEAGSMLGSITPEFIAEAAGRASDGVASGTSNNLKVNVVLESGFGV